MPLSYGRSRYVLPQTVDPSGRVCYVVQVPDDPQHIAAFMGQIYDLAWSKSWQRDTAHTAADVARVWQDVFDSISLCDPVIQFQNPDPCTLQVSFDGGATWTTIYSDADCRAANPIQPGGTPRPDISTCEEFHVILGASGQWFVPFTLSDGDTVEVLDATGIWNDSTSQLFCPDGTTYSAGECSGGPGYNALDPVPTAHHMVPVLLWGSGGVGLETLGAIPGGTGNVDAWLQANEAVLGDNFGNIEFTIRICRIGWCNVWDFATDAYAAQWSTGNGVYGSGMYSNPGSGGNPDTVDIQIDIPAGSDLSQVTVYVNSQNPDTAGAFRGIYRATFDNVQSGYDANSGDYTMNFAVTSAFDGHTLHIQASNEHSTSPGNNHIKKVELRGNGTDPFPARDCP